MSPALAGGFFTTSANWEALYYYGGGGKGGGTTGSSATMQRKDNYSAKILLNSPLGPSNILNASIHILSSTE